MTRIGFIIYYADDTQLKGATLADWDAMPSEGVIAIKEVFDYIYKTRHITRVHAGEDYYWLCLSDMDYVYRGNQFIYKVGDIGASSARYIPPDTSTKRGALVSDLLFETIYNKAIREPLVGTI